MANTTSTKKQTVSSKSVKKSVPVKTKTNKKAKEDSEKNNDRSFRAIYKTLDGEVVKKGRYCGKKPKQAACKALTAILNSYSEETNKKKYKKLLYFGVVETTRGSRHKHYWYSGQKKKVDTVEVQIKGRKDPIVYQYANVVMKASEDDCKDLVPKEDKKLAKESTKKDKKSTKDSSKKTTKKSTKEPSKKAVTKNSKTKAKPAVKPKPTKTKPTTKMSKKK